MRMPDTQPALVQQYSEGLSSHAGGLATIHSTDPFSRGAPFAAATVPGAALQAEVTPMMQVSAADSKLQPSGGAQPATPSNAAPGHVTPEPAAGVSAKKSCCSIT